MLAWLLTDEPLAPLIPWGPWKRCQTLIKRLQWQVWGAGGGRMTSCSWNKTAQILTGRPGGPAGPRGPVPPGSPCVTRHENHFHKKESNKIKVSLPALHRVTEVKLTVSPLGPEDPWGPGRPRSPFSPCSPGGPMRPIRPWWPFSPLAPGSPRRPGKPGGPCRRRSREKKRRGRKQEDRREEERWRIKEGSRSKVQRDGASSANFVFALTKGPGGPFSPAAPGNPCPPWNTIINTLSEWTATHQTTSVTHTEFV